ncbi:hypothetical protein EYZ11_001707 [Aspergillus tanneri]|uniref:Uncharacterized protein n=1 Tax=Aspergillus tanneri TaxID=1220188 RepID=A0A4S3JSJ5_9EURO|nr:hypothetical protein EYZ11_001707 [Aspergillus tanneri]
MTLYTHPSPSLTPNEAILEFSLLRDVWIACCSLAAVAFTLSFLVERHDLDKEQETEQCLRQG